MADDRDILLTQITEKRGEAKRLKEEEEQLIVKFRELPEEVEKREAKRKKEKEAEKIAREKWERECCRGWAIYGLIHISIAALTGLLYAGLHFSIPVPLPLARVALLLTFWPVFFIVCAFVIAAVANGSPEAAKFFIALWYWVSETSLPPLPMVPAPSVHHNGEFSLLM